MDDSLTTIRKTLQTLSAAATPRTSDDVFDTVFSAQTRMRARALERIELLACKFAQDALRAGDGAGGGMPVVRGDRLSRSNRRYENGEAIDEDDPSDGDENDDVGGKRNDESRTSCVVARFTGDGNAYERFWDVLSVLANALRRTDCESGMSLRELYYVMNSRGRRGGSTQTRVTEHQIAATIRKISQALGAPRIALGIVAASKGQVAGRCHIETASGARFDCTACGNDGWAITGDLFELDATKIHSDAAYVIVVEKDAVFNRLCAERVFEKLPCVLVTAKGFPDLATRKFLHLLRRALERQRPRERGAVFRARRLESVGMLDSVYVHRRKLVERNGRVRIRHAAEMDRFTFARFVFDPRVRVSGVVEPRRGDD